MPSRLVRRYKGRKKKQRKASGGSRRSNPLVGNPPPFSDIVEFVLPGFGAFATSRFATRIATTQIAQRKPSWGKHAGALAAIGGFIAAWLAAHKVKWLEKYHTPIVVGAGLAMLQSLIQLYIPRLGWMVSDATPEIATAAAAQQLASGTPQPLPAGHTAVDDDPSLYVYDDRYDAGRMAQQPAGTQAQGAPVHDDLDDLELDDLQHMGIG